MFGHRRGTADIDSNQTFAQTLIAKWDLGCGAVSGWESALSMLALIGTFRAHGIRGGLSRETSAHNASAVGAMAAF